MKTLIIFDMAYFLSVQSDTQLASIIRMLSDAQATPILSAVQALGSYDVTDQVISVDSVLDRTADEDLSDEDIGKFNWLDVVQGKFVWCHPFCTKSPYGFSESLAAAQKFVTAQSLNVSPGNITICERDLPSVWLMRNSLTYFEFNKYTYDKLSAVNKSLLHSCNLLPQSRHRLGSNVRVIDFSSAESLMPVTETLDLNFKDRF